MAERRVDPEGRNLAASESGDPSTLSMPLTASSGHDLEGSGSAPVDITDLSDADSLATASEGRWHAIVRGVDDALRLAGLT